MICEQSRLLRFIAFFLSSFDRKIIPDIGNEDKKRRRWCK